MFKKKFLREALPIRFSTIMDLQKLTENEKAAI